MSLVMQLYLRAREQRMRAANDPAQVSQGTGNTTTAPNTNPPMKSNAAQVSPLGGSVNVQPRWRVAQNALIERAAPRFVRSSDDQNKYTYYQSLRAFPGR